jgi:uncharacterized protein YgbK (DUF1537 family)
MTGWIVADDLTGACDAAAAFAVRGRKALVLGPKEKSVFSAEVLSFSTETRDLPTDQIRSRIEAVLQLISERDQEFLFKKVDSMFRGNTYAELEQWMALHPQRLAVLAPAYPAQKRLVRQGVLRSRDIVQDYAMDLGSALARYAIGFELLQCGSGAAEMMAAWERGNRLVLCDAESNCDLQATAAGGIETGLDILWMGSAGLAHVLAAVTGTVRISAVERPGGLERISAPVVFCIGSDHAVSLRQMLHLKRSHPCCEVFLGPQSQGLVRSALESGSDVLLRIARDQRDSVSLAAALMPIREEPIGGLVLSGGDTASMVCSALQVRAIEVCGEVLSGLPWGVIRGGAANGLLLATKSGGFGDEHALARVADFLTAGDRKKA